MQNNSNSIEQLEELKAAAFLAKWQEQLMKLRDKDQRIAELEEEVKNLKDDCNRLMEQRNEYAHQVRKTMEELEKVRRQAKTERDTCTKQLDEFEKLMYILYHAPKNIKNYFAKKGKY